MALQKLRVIIPVYSSRQTLLTKCRPFQIEDFHITVVLSTRVAAYEREHIFAAFSSHRQHKQFWWLFRLSFAEYQPVVMRYWAHNSNWFTWKIVQTKSNSVTFSDPCWIKSNGNSHKRASKIHCTKANVKDELIPDLFLTKTGFEQLRKHRRYSLSSFQ